MEGKKSEKKFIIFLDKYYRVCYITSMNNKGGSNGDSRLFHYGVLCARFLVCRRDTSYDHRKKVKKNNLFSLTSISEPVTLLA